MAVVAAGVTNAERMFGPKQPGMLGPVAFLLLFVFSALVTGTLVLLPPVRLYLDGHKTEGVRLLLYTAGWLGVITILMLIVIVAVG